MARANQALYINRGHESVVNSSDYESSVKTASQEQCQIYDVLSDSIRMKDVPSCTNKDTLDRKELTNRARCHRAVFVCAVAILAATISGTVTYVVTKSTFSEVKSGSGKFY